jgi:hypothetical protein
MSNISNPAEIGKSAAIARLERLSNAAWHAGNYTRAAELLERAEFLRSPADHLDREAVQQALHANTPQGPDTDPEMVLAWDACDAVEDQGRGTMRGFWEKVNAEQIRSLDWGEACYVRRMDVAREFGVWMDEQKRGVA